MKDLIIVESPTKAKTIASFIQGGVRVLSSYGHVRDLPKSKLGVDTEHNFEPSYIIPTKARKNATLLKKAAQKAARIILATDEDREGEAIAWHIQSLLSAPPRTRAKTTAPTPMHFERIVFHEITRGAIEEALAHPRAIDMNLVHAQQARRVLDRLVGYKLSPFLWKKVAKGLSAGRVQSVALRLIIEREREREKFTPQEYWTIHSHYATAQGAFEAELFSIDEKTLQENPVSTQAQAQRIKEILESAPHHVKEVTEKKTQRRSLPPFITSSLQQEAFRRLHFSSKQTMRIAQRLYERGLITYMRTDSFNLSAQSVQDAREWISHAFGKEFVPSSPTVFKKKTKGAQEAHEAIRPTDPRAIPAGVEGENPISFEDTHEAKLYDLIWRRFIASQMTPAQIHNTSIITEAQKEGAVYQLRASGALIVFRGFSAIWPAKLSEKELPPIQEETHLKVDSIDPQQHFTQPPARYNDASLIKILEENGIGRPSTYAPIISVIQERNYVQRDEQKRFEPTDIGFKVNDLLVEHFPTIVDVDFTAHMEQEFDDVAQGIRDWHDVIRVFYGPFEKTLEKKYEEVEKQQPQQETTDEICEKCGKPMVVKFSRFGKFLGCSGFPECRNTKSLTDRNAHENSPQKSFGSCPTCKEGEIIRRRTKKGRFFYGCSRYPECDYASWTKPESAPAEES